MKKDLEMDIDIGKKIRELRKKKNLNIIDLSQQSGLSTGLISQIERNLVVPTIKAMWKIANVLEVNIGYFFDEDKEDENREEKIIVRKNNRKSINTDDSTKSYELLMSDLNNKSIEFLLVTLKDDIDIYNKELVSHKGEECGYIIDGKMKLILENNEYILEKGDSFYFDSKIPHVYKNYGEDKCILVCAMTPPSF